MGPRLCAWALRRIRRAWRRRWPWWLRRTWWWRRAWRRRPPLRVETGHPAVGAGTRPRLDAHPWCESIMRAFIRVEDAVYVGLGTLLAAMAVALLVAVAISFAHTLLADTLPGHAVQLLDRLLLILMIVEILYTVQVSFSEHALVPEPFLIVGLIATIRRLLVLTAEFARLVESNTAAFRVAMLELGLLTLMIVALVVSLVVLKRHTAHGS